MTISTSRRKEELQAECVVAGISYELTDSREMLMDRLRAALGSFDTKTELDPMKAQETKSLIKLSPAGMDFAGIKHLLNDKFIAEPKYDGVRMRMFVGLTGSSLNSSRRSVVDYKYKDRTGNFPQLAQVCGEQLLGIILDGELVAVTPNVQTGKTMTNSILTASCALNNSSPDKAVAAQKKYGWAEFHVFDILADPIIEDIQNKPYDMRRDILELNIRFIQEQFPDCNIKLVPQLPATEETIRQCMLDGFEGVVLKQKDSIYLPGKRKGWWKVKTMSTADGFIVGSVPGEGRNSGLVGSLELAIVVGKCPQSDQAMISSNPATGYAHSHPQGDNDFCLVSVTGITWQCRKVAQVGNLTDEFREQCTAPDGRLQPDMMNQVIEFVGQGMAKNYRVRHPNMVRIRPDKTWLDCGIDQLSIFPNV